MLVLASVLTVSLSFSFAAQRETVLENHERRRDKLEELLQETREKVANHDAGRNLMEDEEYKTFAKRIGLYERKLEKMKSPLDDRVRRAFVTA